MPANNMIEEVNNRVELLLIIFNDGQTLACDFYGYTCAYTNDDHRQKLKKIKKNLLDDI